MYPILDRNSPVPLYLQIEQMFEDLILNKKLGPDELLPGAPLLAQQLKVSQLTVQKAYRHLQERGLIYSILGKGTFVAEARNQAFVGILIHNEILSLAAQLPTYPLLIGFIRDALLAVGLPVRILTDMNPLHRKSMVISDDVMSALRNERVMGIISLGHCGSDEFFELMRRRSAPVVGLTTMGNGFTAIGQSNDWPKVLRMNARRLREAGRKRPALLWLDARNDGLEASGHWPVVRDAFESEQLELDRDLIIGIQDRDAIDWTGYHAFSRLWRSPKRPDGLIVTDDVIGRGVLMSILAHQVRVPEDLTVIVQSNAESPIIFPEQWHRYEYSLKEMAEKAVQRLRDAMAGHEVEYYINFNMAWHEAARDTSYAGPDAPLMTVPAPALAR